MQRFIQGQKYMVTTKNCFILINSDTNKIGSLCLCDYWYQRIYAKHLEGGMENNSNLADMMCINAIDIISTV